MTCRPNYRVFWISIVVSFILTFTAIIAFAWSYSPV